MKNNSYPMIYSALRFLSLKAAMGVSSAAILLIIGNVLSVLAEQNRYICELHGFRTPCSVWKDGTTISVGGFQAAPIFTLQSPWKAIDHRGNIYKVMKGNGYILFNPAGDMGGTPITIYGLSL